MKKLILYAIKNPISILMYSILILLAGFVSLKFIKMDFLPKLNERTLLVSTSFPGIPSAQMKNIVTIPIENSFSSLKGIKNISSVTRDGLSFIKIELHYRTNINSALIEARQIIDQINQILPENCFKPEVEIFSPNKNQLLKICLIPKNNDLIFTRYIAEEEIKHILQTINGVGKIQISGGLEEEIKILFDENILCSKNLTLDTISQIIKSANYEYPAGTIKNFQNEYILKTSNLYKSFDDILNTSIPITDSLILIKDLGTVQESSKEKETFSFLNNDECICFEIQKKSDANPIETSKLIHKKISELKTKYKNIDFKIINDNSIEIKKSVIGVFISAIIGMIITIVVIFFFFRNLKIALLISAPIPFCILFSITILKILGKTINLFSLAGISISIGIIVDCTIVVIESICKNLEKYKIKNQENFVDNFFCNFDKLLEKSIFDVIKSNFSSTITTIIVFIPFFLLPGIFGELFSDLSISIISSITFSFILSITFVPAISKLFLIGEFIKIKNSDFVNKSQKFYKSLLQKTIFSKHIIKIILLISIFIGFSSIFVIKKEFIQTTKSKDFTFIIEHKNNFTLENIQIKTQKLLKELNNKFPNLIFFTTCGIEKNNYYKLSDFNEKSNIVKISTFQISKKRKKEIENFLKQNQINFSEEKSIDLFSKAFDLNNNYIITAKTKNDFEKIPSLTKNIKPLELSKEEKFIPDNGKCNLYQIPKYFISFYVYQILEGVDAGNFYKNEKLIPMKTKINRNDSQNISSLFIQINGNQIPLSALGKFSTEIENKILYRFNKQDAFETNEKIELGSNYKIISLSKEQFNELKKNSIFLLAIVFILLYCILGAQFSSFKLPLLFLISIIPALSGAIFSLLIFRQTLNVNSILSLVILLGIAVNNSIILYESVLNAKRNSKTFINSFSEKLKPILVTTTTSFVALLPFTVDPFGINSQSSISIAISGGLFFSLITVLIIVPNLLFTTSKNENKND